MVNKLVGMGSDFYTVNSKNTPKSNKVKDL